MGKLNRISVRAKAEPHGAVVRECQRWGANDQPSEVDIHIAEVPGASFEFQKIISSTDAGEERRAHEEGDNRAL